MSNVLRDMRKARKTKQLNASTYVDSGNVISHVAQGILRNSRKVKKDHVLWKPDEDRSHKGDDGKHTSTMGVGGPVPYVS